MEWKMFRVGAIIKMTDACIDSIFQQLMLCSFTMPITLIENRRNLDLIPILTMCNNYVLAGCWQFAKSAG